MIAAPPTADALLRMERITKLFDGTRVLDAVDFDLRPGEVHALIGENGAGKSTLMNVLAGRFNDYLGRITFAGSPIALHHPRHARDLGIAVIYQELSVLPNLTVAENIMLGHEPPGRWWGSLNRRGIREAARAVLENVGFELPLDVPVGALSHAHQCLVEIAHALRQNARVLVFDEPTASLGSQEVEKLFAVIRDLKGRGLGLVYISHRLAELPQIADRVSVLREGKLVATRAMADCTLPQLTRLMLGRELAQLFPAKTNKPGPVVLRVQGLSRPGAFQDVSFELRAGEILGLAGLVGSGRTEIARSLFGADPALGRRELDGWPLGNSPRACRRCGLGLIPENRKRDGNITGLSVAQNLTVGIMDRLAGPAGFLCYRQLHDGARDLIRDLHVSPADPDRSIQLLSGGNQQKVIVGRWLAVGPRVIIFDEPTQGIDIAAKAQLYRLLMDLACRGTGILLISSELIELTKLADRILVIQEGRIAEELPGETVDEEGLFQHCLPGRRATAVDPEGERESIP